ncbi:PREDICTED: LOW QUALITY PROTEIN: hyaluronidase-2-like, partial [Leptosomus discolor]|uniref:LOW QUALITY PROTEIN: hyaluronidase-2-like n=1 Tax=Leptosomus discolor TaxID=188344 RepID=UPI00052265EC
RRPFLVAWNVPTQDCKPRFQVSLDFSLFDLHASPNEGFVGQNLTIFYKERLGLYPYYTSQRVAINSGVPQNSSLSEHLARLHEGISKYIRSPAKEGLGGIRQPTWSREEVNKQAVFEFESAAQQFMVSTLRVAKSFRPKQLWGFYLFPDCYNHDYSKNKESYTGQCPDVEKTRNDQLAWLWRESMALYPSIYLDLLLASTPNSRKFVRARVVEAMRISQQHHDGYSLPVFVYTRPTYIRKLDVLSQPDLISTIGESAALGAAGAIFWGDADYTKNRNSCQILKDYLEGDLGRYIVNVTTAAQRCSTVLCQGRGRCLRQDSTADVFLHLNSTSFQLRRRDGDDPQRPLFWAEGQVSPADTLFLRTHFRCQKTYQGWQGSSCQVPADPRSDAPDPLSPLGLGVLLLLASWC